MRRWKDGWRFGKEWHRLGSNCSAVPEGRAGSIIHILTLKDHTTWHVDELQRCMSEQGRSRELINPDRQANASWSAANTPGTLPSQSTPRKYCGDIHKRR